VTALRKPPLKIVGSEPDTQADENQRVLEAILFAAADPVDEKVLKARLPEGADLKAELEKLAEHYAVRGVNLVRVAGKWALRTASDLGHRIAKDTPPPRKLSRAAIETLAIVAYHQPVTRAEIEEIRGVTINTGTLDVLIQTGWVRLRGRRKVPGRPVTYGTTDQFLIHFGLDQIEDLPGLDELKGAGFLDDRLPAGFAVPIPNDISTLRDDEEPLEEGVPELDPDATK
jgi:segregation and condensation protein B